MIYVSFLRGINVGGKNKIKMADLKRELEDTGLINVQTYIQSGNVVFESVKIQSEIKNEIATVIENKFGIKTAVILRTADELMDIITYCPYSKEEIANAKTINTLSESFYVALLNGTPGEESIKNLETYKTEYESFRIKGQVIYMLFFNSIRNSKLVNIIQKLDPNATVRNFNTIEKLCSLVKGRM